jgi:preprotein translocase subunit SecE
MAKHTATVAKHPATTKQGFSITKFFGDITAELKKVVWLSRREVVYLTVVVLIVAAIAGAVLGALDLGFTNLVDKFFLGG